MFGIDYSSGRPSHAAMKGAGVGFVVRYIGSVNHGADRDPKFLSPAEAWSLHADGFDLCVVFETTAGRADGGRTAGLADARLAVAELAFCGLPVDLPVYFAVDYDATVGPRISAYFGAINEVLGLERTGGYGGYRVIEALFDKGLIAYGWQTYAWSDGRWDPRNHIEQYSNGQRVGGEDVDYDRSNKADFGQWPAGGPPVKEEDMPYGQLPAKANVPNGTSKANISFPKGSKGSIGLVYDSPVKAKVRVAFHHKSGGGEVYTVDVGGPASARDAWPAKTVIVFKNKADGDWVSLERQDDGPDPVGWDMS